MKPISINEALFNFKNANDISRMENAQIWYFLAYYETYLNILRLDMPFFQFHS